MEELKNVENVTDEKDNEKESKKVGKGKKIAGIIAKITLSLCIGAFTYLYLNDYGLYLDGFTQNDSDHYIIYKEGEYTFECHSVATSDSEWRPIDSINAYRKVGFLYQQVDENEKYVKEFTLYDKDGESVALMTQIKGKDAYYYFIIWIQDVRLANDDDEKESDESDNVVGYSTFRMLSDKVTVDGNEIKLDNYSFFSVKEEVKSIEVLGEKLDIKAE